MSKRKLVCFNAYWCYMYMHLNIMNETHKQVLDLYTGTDKIILSQKNMTTNSTGFKSDK